MNFNGVTLAWWADKNLNNHTIEEPYNCQCDKAHECVDQISKCNCDAKLPEILTDYIRIRDKSKLPITGFHYGPMTYENAKATVLFKNFQCSSNYLTDDLRVFKVIRNYCNAFQYTNSFEYHMRYIDGRNCYTTIELSGNSTIKITASSFNVIIELIFIF